MLTLIQSSNLQFHLFNNESQLSFLTELPEFRQYFNRSDLVKLSGLSKGLRKRLLSSIFNQVFFSNDTEFSFNKLLKEYYSMEDIQEFSNDQLHYIYHSYFQYYERENNSIESQMSQFNQHSSLFQPYLKALTIRQGINQAISNFNFNFNQLKSLSIINAKLEFNSISSILNNSIQLSILYLANSNIVFNSKTFKDSGELVLNFPLSMTQLHLESSYLVKGLVNDPIIAGQRFFNVISELKYSNFNIGELKGLKVLTCKNMVNNGEFIQNILARNPSVKKLNTYLIVSKEETLNYLNYSKLTSVSLQCTSDINLEYFTTISLPKLPSLTHLKFSNIDTKYTFIFNKFLLNCPNLIELEIEFNGEWIGHYNSISSRLPKLKKLKVTNRTLVNSYKLEGIRGDTLEVIELECFQLNQVNLANLEVNQNLKQVTIVKCCRDPSLSDFKLIVSKFPNWICYLGQENIQCYRT